MSVELKKISRRQFIIDHALKSFAVASGGIAAVTLTKAGKAGWESNEKTNSRKLQESNISQPAYVITRQNKIIPNPAYKPLSTLTPDEIGRREEILRNIDQSEKKAQIYADKFDYWMYRGVQFGLLAVMLEMVRDVFETSNTKQ